MPEDVNGDIFGSMFEHIMKRIDKADPKTVEEACIRIKNRKEKERKNKMLKYNFYDAEPGEDTPYDVEPGEDTPYDVEPGEENVNR